MSARRKTALIHGEAQRPLFWCSHWTSDSPIPNPSAMNIDAIAFQSGNRRISNEDITDRIMTLSRGHLPDNQLQLLAGKIMERFERSGLKERRHVDDSQKQGDMAIGACHQAMDRAGVTAGDIDLLIHPCVQLFKAPLPDIVVCRFFFPASSSASLCCLWASWNSFCTLPSNSSTKDLVSTSMRIFLLKILTSTSMASGL